MVSGQALLIAVVAGIIIYGGTEVEHAAVKGWKQTVCLVKTGHHCPKKVDPTAPVQTQPQVPAQ